MTGITFVLTYACNQDCTYCFQIKDNQKMEFGTARKTIDHFSKNGHDDIVINFYGGEPLLEYQLMKRIVQYGEKVFHKKGIKLEFSVTTNGILLKKEHMAYCSDHGVDIYLSVDGVKKAHENGRGKGIFASIEKVLSLYKLFPKIPLRIQTVITPKNVKYLLQSVQFLVELGTRELSLNFCYDQKWTKKELQILQYQYNKTYKFLMKTKSEGNKIQFREIKKPDPLKPLFRCEAGKDRFAITPDGYLYGCSMHIPWSKRASELGRLDCFSDFCLGHIDHINSKKFKKSLEKLYRDKRSYGPYYFSTFRKKCIECKYVIQCDLCPVYATIYNQDKLEVPYWICDIKKIQLQTGLKYGVPV